MSSLNLKLAPSILSADFANLAKECKEVEEHVEWFHVDVMDGHFVPNLTIGPCVVASMRKHLTKAFLDVHLMVSNPAQWIEPMAKAGANQFCFHIEAVDDHEEATEICEQIRKAGMYSAISVKPKTPAESIEQLVRNKSVDYVLIMTVEPGFGGQSFMADQLSKVRFLRAIDAGLNIGVDGGIGPETAREAWDAGANCMVAGSAIFSQPDRLAAIKEIRSKCAPENV